MRDGFFSDYFIRWSGQSQKGRQDWLVLADGDRTPPLFSDECRDDVIGDCLDLASGQRRRMRIARRIGAQILTLEAIAVVSS